MTTAIGDAPSPGGGPGRGGEPGRDDEPGPDGEPARGTAGPGPGPGDAGPVPAAALAPVPELRWTARAASVHGVEDALAAIWRAAPATAIGADGEEHVVARASVLNLVAVAHARELAERAEADFVALAGRHPSRTILIEVRDPDGPRRIDADVVAQCLLPRDGGAVVCTETIRVVLGGEAGRHLASIVPQLVVHDLPVTLWWAGDVPFEAADFHAVARAAVSADRLVVDGSAWRDDGLAGVRRLGQVLAATPVAISDFALMRQSRWREAIAAAFDEADLMPFVRSIREVTVSFSAGATTAATAAPTNITRPLYHVAWLGSRLEWTVRQPLVRRPDGCWNAQLRRPRGSVTVTLMPEVSTLPRGATTHVAIVAAARRSELRVDVMGHHEAVVVRASLDGTVVLDRAYGAARRTEADLLAEAIESGGRVAVETATIRLAAELARGPDAEAAP
jgi:glucose-6-phosphate dehydrogenase assembly protein OpcA